jgi:hypothetical protein
MVDPVVTGALVWLVQRLLDKGFDRIFDAALDTRNRAQPPARGTLAPMVAPRRHDLTVDGAQGTSDLDVTVRPHLQLGRAPVILTFQKFGTNSGGTTFPMVVGDTAHLTLRRDHYLIAALVVDLPRKAGAKPTLRGLGWTQQWVADNHVRTVTVTTQHPTEKLVKKLGLRKSDGSCPFVLAPSATTSATDKAVGPAVLRSPLPKPAPPDHFGKFLPARPGQTGGKSAKPPFSSSTFFASALFCRARTGVPNLRCTSTVWADKLCHEHWKQVRNGHPVHDFQTGARLWTS